MNSKIKNVIFPLAAVLFILPWSLLKCERNKNAELKYEKFKLEANIEALHDTVRQTRDKNDELEFNRKSFITDRTEDLEKLSSDLASELEATKGKVLFLSKSKTKILVHDAIPGRVDTFNTGIDSGLVVGFNLDTAYSPGNTRKLQGKVTIGQKTPSAEIQEEIGLAAVTGLKKNDKGDYEIFFRSQYPNLTITSLEGNYIPANQLIPPTKRKRLGVGLNLSYSPIAYKLSTKQFAFEGQITIGAGIHYRLF